MVIIPEKYAHQFGKVAKQPIRLGKVLELGPDVVKNYAGVIEVGSYVLIDPLNLGKCKSQGETYYLPIAKAIYCVLDEEDVPEEMRV